MINVDKYIDGKELFDSRYRLLRQLSTEGGTADVWLAEDAYTVDSKFSEDEEDEVVQVEGSGVRVAIKIYRPKNILDIEGEHYFKQEFKTVFSCHHANLLQPTDFSICDNMPYLVMPYCENGSSEKLVGRMVQKEDIWKFLFDVSSGLAYLHACKPPIIHQDIKPANILIDSNQNYCITDFGISVKSGVKSDYYLDNESCGTTIYMSPERFREGYKPRAESDIWSFGATIYELVTGDVPFGSEGGNAQLTGVKIPVINQNIPKEIKKLIYTCLDDNPSNRPTASDIAEFARTKGKKHILLYLLLSFSIIVTIVCIVGWMQLKPQPVDKFTSFCNSGDSIITIEKQNAMGDDLINVETLTRRTGNAIRMYENALIQETGNTLKRDSIKNRISAIKGLTPLVKYYLEICDTLNIAKDDDLPLRIEEFTGKQKRMSKIIKKNIAEL